MAANPEEDFITVAEAARLLRVSIVTLQRWIKQGRIPAYRLGPRYIRIRRPDLAKLLVPTSREEAEPAPEAMSVWLDVKPLTEHEVQQRMEAIHRSEDLIARMRARKGGSRLSSSWRLIRQTREERSKRL